MIHVFDSHTCVMGQLHYEAPFLSVHLIYIFYKKPADAVDVTIGCYHAVDVTMLWMLPLDVTMLWMLQFGTNYVRNINK